MQMHASTGCVLMASGLSTRFGSNKLLAQFDGQPLLCRAFAATDTPQLSARIVVTRSAQVQALCKAQGVPGAPACTARPERYRAAGTFGAAGTASGTDRVHVSAR